MARTLFQKVWDAHTVRTLPNGQTQLYIGLHLVHEVTSPQAFAELRERGWTVRAPQRTFATIDHIVPTRAQARPFADAMAESMTEALERNCRDYGIQFFDLASGSQGIVHVIGPEMGLTQPGMTIACGDSHTSTHGAFGAIAFGIGTSQVRDVLASQCLALSPLKVRRIEVNGALRPRVYAKDVILTIIGRLGVKGGTGYAYEYAGDVFDRMTMDERMTVCNMSIEGGARVGYVNPDDTTFEFLRGRRFVPAGAAFDQAVTWWRGMASDAGAPYDDVIRLQGEDSDLGHQPGPVRRRRRAAAEAGRGRDARARGPHRGARLHGLPAGTADRRHARRCRLHRLLHQRPPLRSPRSRARRRRPSRRVARARARRAGIAEGRGRRREGRPRSSLP
jgi:3-isopropylmalate/(R)-2-methylmalate dehydratase large subunit